MSIFGITLSKKSSTAKTSTQIQKVSWEIERLEKELLGLGEREGDFKQKVELLKKVLSSKKENLEFYYDSCDEKKESIENFTQAQTKYKESIAAYEDKLNVAQIELKNITLQLTDFENSHMSFKNSKDRLNKKVQQVEEAIIKEKQRKEQKEDAHHLVEGEYQDLNFKLVESEKDFNDLKDIHDIAEQKLSQLRKRLDEKRDEYCTISANLENIRKKELYVKEAIESTENDIQESSQKVFIAKAELDQEKNHLTEKIDSLNDKKQVETKYQVQLNKLFHELARVKDDLSLVEIDYSSIQESSRKIKVAEKEVEGQIVQAQAQKKNVTHSLQITNRELESLRSKYSQKETRLDEVSSWVSELEEQEAVLEEQEAVLRVDLSHQQRELVEVERSLGSLEKKHLEVKRVRSITKDKITELISIKQDKESTLERLKINLESTEEELETNEVQYRELEIDLERYQNDLIEAQNELSSYTTDMQQKEKFILEAKNQLSVTQSCLSKVSLEVIQLSTQIDEHDVEIKKLKLIRSNESKSTIELDKQHVSLTKKKKQLEIQNTELKETNLRLLQNNDDLKSQVSLLVSEEADLTESLLTKSELVLSLKKTKELAKHDTKVLRVSMRSLRDSSDQLEIEKTKIEKSIAHTEIEKSQLEADYDELSLEFTESRKVYETVHSELTQMRESIQGLEGKKADIARSTSNYLKKGKELSAEINSSLIRERILSDELKTLGIDFENVESQVISDEQKLYESQRKSNDLEKKKFVLEERTEKLKNKRLRNINERIEKKRLSSDLVLTIKELEEQVVKLQLDEQTSREELSNQELALKQSTIDKKSLKNFVQKLEETNKKVQSFLDDLRKSKSEVQKELDTLGFSEANLRVNNSDIQCQLDLAKDEISALREKTSLQNNTIRDINEYKLVIENEMKTLLTEKDDLEKEVNFLSHEEQRVENAYEKEKKRQSEMESEVIKVGESLALSNERLTEVEEQTKETDQIIAELNSLKTELLDSLEVKKSNHNRLNRQLKERKVHLDSLQIESFSSESKAKKVEQRNALLKKELENTNTEIMKRSTVISSLHSTQDHQRAEFNAINAELKEKKVEFESIRREEVQLARKINSDMAKENLERKNLRDLKLRVNSKNRELQKRRMEVKSFHFDKSMVAGTMSSISTKKLIAKFELFVGLNFFEVDLEIVNKKDIECREIPPSIIRDYEKILNDFSSSMGIIRKLKLSMLNDKICLNIEGIEHNIEIEVEAEMTKDRVARKPSIEV